ncbi:MAG: hypothetical protein ACPG5U_11790 [Planktomarina sp.]
MSDQVNPFAVTLRATVERAYDAFARYKVSETLEVCHCNVCMSEETRREIIDTPVRHLRVEAIWEYTNSAHGLPANTDDLKALMPRYLDIIAQDELVDYHGSGNEMSRFGQALKKTPDLFDTEEWQAIEDWYQAALLYFAWEDLHDGAIWTPMSLFLVILVGGLPVHKAINGMNVVFDDPIVGDGYFAAFCKTLLSSGALRKDGLYHFNMYELQYTELDILDVLFAWLNGPVLKDRLSALDFSQFSEEDQISLSMAFTMFGYFDPTVIKLSPYR